MLQGIRIKEFNRNAKIYGKQALLNRLKINFNYGITYHRPNGEKEIMVENLYLLFDVKEIATRIKSANLRQARNCLIMSKAVSIFPLRYRTSFSVPK
jgi:hypothetical protein